jgi:hypothetical protein
MLDLYGNKTQRLEDANTNTFMEIKNTQTTNKQVTFKDTTGWAEEE